MRVRDSIRLGAAAVAVAGTALGCGEPLPDEVPHGSWGGEGALLEVDATGAGVELDCAHGRIESKLRLDAAGRFSEEGFLVTEGGPVRPEGVERIRASYAGRLTGRRLEFSIELPDAGRTDGPFAVAFGEPARLRKCLSPEAGL